MLFVIANILTNNQKIFFRKFVIWYFKIQWSRTFSNSSRAIVMWAVARTIVPSKVSSIGNWYTSEVSANPQNDQVIWLLCSFTIGLWISQGWYINRSFCVDLLLCSRTSFINLDQVNNLVILHYILHQLRTNFCMKSTYVLWKEAFLSTWMSLPFLLEYQQD